MSDGSKALALGIFLGVGCAAWFGAGAFSYALLGVAAAIAYFALFPRREYGLFFLLFIVALFGGMKLHERALARWITLSETSEYTGIVEVIERSGPHIFYRPVTLRPKAVAWRGGDILYRAPLDFTSQPGDKIEFSGSLKRPKNFDPNFDYRMFLAMQGIGYTSERGAVGQGDSGNNKIRRWLYLARSVFRDRVEALLPEPESGLLIGLIIGGNDLLSPETKVAFTRSGLSHIVAVSGYNMSVVAEMIIVMCLLLGLWRRVAISIAVIGLVFFLLIIDGSAASLRAALMAWFAFGAYFIGRPAVSWNALLLVGAGMLVMNPLLLRYDVGFQLSFLATMSLLVFARYFETFQFFRSRVGQFIALFLATIIIELFTLPVIVSTFGTVSLVAPFANVLVLPLVPIAMFVGIGSAAITALIPGLAAFVVPFAWLPVTAIIHITEGFATLPWAVISGLDSTPIFAMLWYLGLSLGVWGLERLRLRYVLGMDH